MSKAFAVTVLAISCFVFVSFWVVRISLVGIKAMQNNYAVTLNGQYIQDLDRDGISDNFDDSDGDGVADALDPTPYGPDSTIFSLKKLILKK